VNDLRKLVQTATDAEFTAVKTAVQTQYDETMDRSDPVRRGIHRSREYGQDHQQRPAHPARLDESHDMNGVQSAMENVDTTVRSWVTIVGENKTCLASCSPRRDNRKTAIW